MDDRLEHRLQEALSRHYPQDDWNYKHSCSAAYWVKRLMMREGGNERVLLAAVYLHDIGYAIIGSGMQAYEERKVAKPVHMEAGAAAATEILAKIGYTAQERDRVAHLISVHDNLESLHDPDELLLMEADSLAGIDVRRVKPTFSKEEYRKYLVSFEQKRVPRFTTSAGKQFLAELLPAARVYAGTPG